MIANTLIYFGTAFDLNDAVKYLGFVPNIRGFYTWFTSMFLHGDFLSHLLWNMYFLWLFGAILEDALGKLKFSLIYLTSGLVACLIHGAIISVFVPSMASAPLIGASGAIAGLLGVFVVRFYKNKISVFYFIFILLFIRWGVFEITSVAALSIWFGRELLSGLFQLGGVASGVAHWAHIGGFVFGAIIALAFCFEKEADAEYLSEEAASWARMGIYSGASSRYEELLDKDFENAEVYRKLAESMLFSGNGEKETIVHNYEKAIELFLKAQKKQEAFRVYQELNDAYSDVVLDPKSQLAMGSLSESQSQFELAVKTYRKLIDNHPVSVEAEKALFRLAHVYLKMGLEEEARVVWSQFLEKYPNSQWIPFADTAFTVSDLVK
jgi:membrane associated rhomboid family serine protease